MGKEVNEVMEGYKETEIGVLPADWEVVRLGELSESGVLKLKNGFPCGNHNEQGLGIPHLRPLNITSDGRVDLHTIKYVQTEQDISDYLLQLGDVIFNNTNSEELVGKTAYWEGRGHYVLSNHMTIIRVVCPNIVEPYFLARALHKRWVEGYYVGVCRRHVNQASISLERLKQVLVPLPPVSEQRKIAHVLSTIQKAIELQDKIISALRELKKSLMRHLFTYGPVPVDQIDRVPLKETEIGMVPEHWEVVRLGDLFEIQQGKSLSSKYRRGKSPHPFLRTANVLWGYVDLSALDEMDFTEEEVQRFTLLPGDLLVCEGGDIGRTAIWQGQLKKCCYQNHLHRLRMKSTVLVPQFYVYWMQAAILLFGLYIGEGNKTTIPNLSKARLSNFRVPFPPFPEQRQIAHILTTVDNKITSEQQRKSALQSLFQTMLHLLMTGRVRVKDLEVNEDAFRR